METKHFAVLTAAVCICSAMTGCGNEIPANESLASIDGGADHDISSADEDTSSLSGLSEYVEVRNFDETEISPKTIKYTKYSKTYEAESGTVSGKASVKKEREGFEGEGYVTGISDTADWELNCDLPQQQYYNISITVASDESVQNGIALNGNKISEFTTDGSGGFETISFNNILLDSGISVISIVPENGLIDLDRITITASKDIEDLSFELEDPALSNKNADYNTQALYSYLCECYGTNVILGQHDTAGTTAETELIYRTTGKYPAIRFGDMMPFTDESSDAAEDELAAAIQWAEDGGIVGYMWHWNAPSGKDGYYSDKTDFDLSKAVTKESIATLDIEDIEKLQAEGKVSEECVALVKDIDIVSQQLLALQEEGITVLWRPLHEASNGYFWWGCDEASYKWLWKLMYKRQTKYHNLNNLIWVWSAQNSSWYVGDSYCDLLSVDVYSDDSAKEGQVNSLLYLQSISANKPIAMSECGSFPLIQNIADQKAMWSYIGQWGGNFIMDDEGKLSEEYNTEADLIMMYNNDLTITRDKLPDFTHLANNIKEAAEQAEKAAETTSSETESSVSETEKVSDTSSRSDN